jgi:hypothetical protein
VKIIAAITLLAAFVVVAPATGASDVPPAPALSVRSGDSVARAHVTCNGRYPANGGAALCPLFTAHPAGHLPIAAGRTIRVTVRGATQVTAELTRPHKHDPTKGLIIARLPVDRVRGARNTYNVALPRRIPAHTSGFSATAELHARHFASYALGVRVRDD